MILCFYCVYVDNSQKYVFSSNFFPKFQTHVSSCLLDVSDLMSNIHLKHISPKLNFSLFLSPSSSTYSSAGFSMLLMAVPSFHLFIMLSSLISLLYSPYPIGWEICWLYLQNIHRIWALLTTYIQIWATDITYLDYCSQPLNSFVSTVSFQ